ncbi:MAG TPA: pyridoxamine 5'-phosphate oxidase family protein [Spirochaetota bacterium]|nr:pyridoxamine 5'-phosphate oxidase family protein [Spirochaetota bacterium]
MMKETALQIIKEAPAAYLTTTGLDGYPETRAMLNLRNEKSFPKLKSFWDGFNEFEIFFTTNTSSSKIGQIKNNTKVSLYYCNPASWLGLMMNGDIEIFKDEEVIKKLWQEEWTMYYPGGYNDPDHTVLRFIPKRVKLYSSLAVHELL